MVYRVAATALNRFHVPCPVGLDPSDDDDADGLRFQEGLRDS